MTFSKCCLFISFIWVFTLRNDRHDYEAWFNSFWFKNIQSDQSVTGTEVNGQTGIFPPDYESVVKTSYVLFFKMESLNFYFAIWFVVLSGGEKVLTTGTLKVTVLEKMPLFSNLDNFVNNFVPTVFNRVKDTRRHDFVINLHQNSFKNVLRGHNIQKIFTFKIFFF